MTVVQKVVMDKVTISLNQHLPATVIKITTIIINSRKPVFGL